MRSNRRPARSAVQRAWAGMFVQREFRSWQRPLAAASEACLSEEQISLPRLQLFTPRRTPRAVAELAREALGFAPAQFRSRLWPFTRPPDAPAQSAVQRAWAGVFVQREFRSWLWPFTPRQTPPHSRRVGVRAPGFVPAQFRSWQRPLAAASEDCLSTGQSLGPFLAATPTVPSQRCGPSCSPSPRGNGGRTRGRGSRSARAQQSPGQSRPSRRSWRGCW